MLSVKYGPFQPSLEDAFIGDLRELKSQDPLAHLSPSASSTGRPRRGRGWPLAPVAVVAPSRRMADRLQKIAAGAMPLLNVHFHTFYSLALRLAEESKTAVKPVLGDGAFYDQLVEDLLKTEPARRLAGDRVRSRGLSKAVRSTLKDLSDAGVEPAKLLEMLEEGLLDGHPDQGPLKALLELQAAYEARVAALPVAPPSDLTRAAAGAAAESGYLRSFRRILAYGFYDLTGLQWELFEALAQNHETTLYYPYVKGHPAFAFAETFFKSRLHMGGAELVELPVETDGRALGPAWKGLFAAGAGAAPAGCVRILNVSGTRDELWAVAKEALRLVEEEGFAFSDIGVAARSLEPYRALLGPVFEEQGVPYSCSAGETLLRQPVAKLALSLLMMRQRDFPAVAVLDIIGSPYFRTDRDAGELSDWRTLIERLRIHRGLLQWEGKLERWTREDLELRPDLREEGRQGPVIGKASAAGLLALIRDFDRDLGEGPGGLAGWKSKARYARAFLESRIRLPEDAAPRERGAFGAVLGLLEGLESFDHLGTEPGWNGFLEAFEDRVRGAVLDAPEPGSAGVRVLDAMEARGDSFRALFLIGLKEKQFPRLIQEDALLRDRARTALRDDCGYWVGPKLAGYEEEKLLFALLAGAAEERLTCVYPRSDEEGKSQVPSLYLRELCRACGIGLADEATSAYVFRQPFEKIRRTPAGLLNPKETSLLYAMQGLDPSHYHEAVGMDARAFRECLEAVEALNAAGPPGPYDGTVGKPSAFEARLAAKGLSATALDQFGHCPFQFFGARVLGLAEPKEPAEPGEIPSDVKGEIYHRALELFYKRLVSRLPHPLLQQVPLPQTIEERGRPLPLGEGARSMPDAFPESALREILGEVFGASGWREMGIYPLLWKSARRALSERLTDFLRWDFAELGRSGFKPTHLEKEFSGELGVETPIPLRLRGRPDRVDVAGGRFRVIDYKTRWTRGKLVTAALRGESHQPPVYLELVGQALGLEPAGVQIRAVEDEGEEGGPAVYEMSADEWASVREPFRKNAAFFVEEMHGGRFPIRPSGERGYCGWCPFAAACRKGHPATLRRARSGEAFDRFEAVKSAKAPKTGKAASR